MDATDPQTDNVEMQEVIDKWRAKLRNVIHSTTFCGLCMDDDKSVWDLNVAFSMSELGSGHNYSLINIMQTVFGNNIMNLLANNVICEDCTNKAIQAYTFIYNTKRSTRILMACVKNMSDDVEYTLSSVEDIEEYEKSIICLSMDEILSLDLTELETQLDEVIHVTKYPNSGTDAYKCTHCNQIFANSVSLHKHITSHDTKGINNSSVGRNVPKKEERSIKHNSLTITQCSICKLVVLNVEMEDHIKSHSRVNNKWHCALCDEAYYSITSFDKHLMSIHNITNESLFTCDFCSKTFFSSDALQSHKCKYRCSECSEMPCPHHKFLLSYRDQKEEGKKQIQCVECDYECTRKISILSHANVDHLQRFSNMCDKCGLSFQSKPALTQHTIRFHNFQHKCAYCNKGFACRSVLEKHNLTCTSSCDTFQCHICLAYFTNDDELSEHKEQHFNNPLATPLDNGKDEHLVTISCTMCKEDFCSKEDYKTHVVTHAPDSKHICRICDATFNSKINHRKHTNWHIMALKRRTCKVCSKSVSITYFKTHMAIHTRAQGSNEKKINKTAHLIRRYKCDQCGKCFVNLNVLKRHKEIHKEHEKCDICEKYLKPSMLESHLEDHKKGRNCLKAKNWKKRIIKCMKCEYVTHYPLCMEAHENRFHLKVRPFKCIKCGKDFHARNNFKEHMKSHEYNTDKRRECEFCSKSFANSQCLKKHMRLHTGERPYPCDECEERFMSSSRRQEHKIRRHSPPKATCPFCNKLYHTVRDLRAHIKKSHCHIRKGNGNVFDLEAIPEEHRHVFKDLRRGD